MGSMRCVAVVACLVVLPVANGAPGSDVFSLGESDDEPVKVGCNKEVKKHCNGTAAELGDDLEEIFGIESIGLGDDDELQGTPTCNKVTYNKGRAGKGCWARSKKYTEGTGGNCNDCGICRKDWKECTIRGKVCVNVQLRNADRDFTPNSTWALWDLPTVDDFECNKLKKTKPPPAKPAPAPAPVAAPTGNATSGNSSVGNATAGNSSNSTRL